MTSVLPTEGQKRIDWICVCEYIPIQSHGEAFRDSINSFLTESEETIPPFAGENIQTESIAGINREFRIELPNNPSSLFKEVIGVLTTDTNHLARLVICGKVDTNIIDLEREAAIDALQESERADVKRDSNIPSEVQNIDEQQDIAEEILDRGKNELCDFLNNEVSVGLISSDDIQWFGSDTKAYPYIYYYDFTGGKFNIDSVEQLWRDYPPKSFQIRISEGSQVGQNPTVLPKSSNLICGRGKDVIQSPLGQIPIGFASIHLGDAIDDEAGTELDNSRAHSENKLPKEVDFTFQTVNSAVAGVYWSLYTYHRIRDLNPDLTTGFDESLNNTIKSCTDSELSAILTDLYERQHELDILANTFDAEIFSVNQVGKKFSDQLESNSAFSPLLTASEEFFTICEKRVNQYEKRYNRYIERVRAEVEVNIGVVGKKISYSVLALTAISILIQVPVVLSEPHDEITNMSMIFVLFLSILILFGVLIIVREM